jgi:DNA-binding CsgD family transcriptional regulator
MKANLVQALERVRVEGLLSAMARRRLSTDLQALSLELIRISVRLEEVSESTKGDTSPQAPIGEVARSSSDLHAIARRNREALVRAGELVTSKTLADKLGISPQAVTKARNEKRFFALDVGGEDYYPGFYADPGLDRKVLEDITRVLGDLPGAEKLVFFRSALGSLGDLTPLAALRAGKRAPVERAAAAFAER